MGTLLKSFAGALATPPSPLRPSERPTPWEAYLLGLVNKLQQENQEMQTLIKQLQQKVEETSRETKEAPAISTQGEVNPPIQDEKFKNEFKQEIFSQLAENERITENKNKIRVGGLQEGWEKVDYLEPEETDEYLTTNEIWRRKLTKTIPFVEIGDPAVEIKGKHVILHYSDKGEKINVMKQTKSLAGTSVWMQDELTLLQLKNRKAELAKVKEARKQGKWAVYRDGVAIIGEFHKPKEATYSPTRPLSPWS